MAIDIWFADQGRFCAHLHQKSSSNSETVRRQQLRDCCGAVVHFGGARSGIWDRTPHASTSQELLLRPTGNCRSTGAGGAEGRIAGVDRVLDPTVGISLLKPIRLGPGRECIADRALQHRSDESRCTILPRRSVIAGHQRCPTAHKTKPAEQNMRLRTEKQRRSTRLQRRQSLLMSSMVAVLSSVPLGSETDPNSMNRPSAGLFGLPA